MSVSAERHPGEGPQVAPERGVLLPQLRPGGTQHHDGGLARIVHEVFDEGQERWISPVKIFEDDDQRSGVGDSSKNRRHAVKTSPCSSWPPSDAGPTSGPSCEATHRRSSTSMVRSTEASSLARTISAGSVSRIPACA